MIFRFRPYALLEFSAKTQEAAVRPVLRLASCWTGIEKSARQPAIVASDAGLPRGLSSPVRVGLSRGQFVEVLG
ncbi:hypothetical protein D9M70_483910 [compost metagenome]